MGKYSYYDEVEQVISTDLTDIVATPELVDEVVDEVIAIARQLPRKVFMLVCWKNVVLDHPSAIRHGQRLTELLNYVQAIVRYDVTETFSRIAIRAETVKHSLQKAQAHIYSSREEALSVIHRLEQELLQKC